MKKSISLLIILCMLFGLAACGDKADPTPIVVPEETITLTSPFDLSLLMSKDIQINLGEGLPSFVLSGAYLQQEVPEKAQQEDGLEVWLSTFDNRQEFTISRFPGSGSLKKSAQAFADKYGYDKTVMDSYQELDSFEGQEIRCGNFCFHDASHEAGEYDIDAYMLEDGDNIVLVEYWTMN